MSEKRLCPLCGGEGEELGRSFFLCDGKAAERVFKACHHNEARVMWVDFVKLTEIGERELVSYYRRKRIPAPRLDDEIADEVISPPPSQELTDEKVRRVVRESKLTPVQERITRTNSRSDMRRRRRHIRSQVRGFGGNDDSTIG